MLELRFRLAKRQIDRASGFDVADVLEELACVLEHRTRRCIVPVSRGFP